MIEEHLTRPTAALRARIPGGRQLAIYVGALALALPVGVLAGRALAPEVPETQVQPDASRSVAQQRLARTLATLDRARAGGRAELRQARTPRGQEQAARRLARAHGDAAESLSAAPVVTAAALIDGLTRMEEAYAGLARAARLGAGARFAAARRAVEREEIGLPGALAGAAAPAPRTAVAPASADSGTPLALLALVLGLAAAGLIVRPRRRLAPARSTVPRRVARSTTAPVAAAAGWSCEISCAAGLRGAGFRAVASAPGREPVVIARSPNVASPPFLTPTPEGQALTVARVLVRGLLAAGWTPTTRARHWYSQRFEWPGDADPEPLPHRAR